MADWELMRQCFCVLWFGDDHTNASSTSTRRRPSTDGYNNRSAPRDHDPLCSYAQDDATADSTFTPTYANVIEDALYTRVAVSICCFGLLGNLVNLVVLSSQRTQGHAGRMQQFARIGLMSLAMADALVCVSILPHAFVERDPLTTYVSFSLVYSAYGEALINVFAMVGTWLTVAMAAGRYAAVCHPFRARAAIGRTVALRLIVIVCAGCVLFNIPRFFMNSVDTMTCTTGFSDHGGPGVNRTWYFRWFGPLHTHRHRRLELTYVWIYFTMSVVVPLGVLLFTGYRLACWLRRDRLDGAPTEECGPAAVPFTADVGRFQDIDRSFTLTFVAVALMHITLVSPAELLNFSRGHLLSADASHNSGYAVYNLLASVLNTLQAANYSFNFLLYCAVNVTFRRRFVELLRCRSRETVENRLRLQIVANSGALERSSVGSYHARRNTTPRRSATTRDRSGRTTLSDPIY